MVVERSPREITDEGWYWLRAKDVTGRPRIARDTYFPNHGVTRPAAITEDDLPPAETEATRAVDLEALDQTFVSGKWVVERLPSQVDDLWSGLVEDVSAERIWDVKITTKFGRIEFEDDKYNVAVYTPNYFEKSDVQRVRDRLRDTHGVTERIVYKPDIYTSKGIYPETASQWGLTEQARYEE